MTYAEIFLRLLTEEDRVPCTGSHPYSALSSLALEASLVVCEGRLGCLHQKLLIVICGLDTIYTQHLNVSDVDYLYETGLCWTILLSEY